MNPSKATAATSIIANRPAAVSIIIPCRNEVRFIPACLNSVLENGYPLECLEVLIVDGMSDDGTRDLLREYAARHHFIRVVDNVQKLTPYALNIAIREAKGEVLMRMDAHTVYEKGYIARCVGVLLKYGADDVGGTLRIIPQTDTFMGRSIVKALTNKFGVGNLRYRFEQPEEPEQVDTVAFFCVKRELFQRIGLFNEKLARIQDMEFKRRLARSGGTILLAPGAFADYRARSDLPSFWLHNWSDGVWTVLAFADSELMPVRWRHLVPAAFAAILVTTLVVALAVPTFAWLFTVVVGIYLLAALAISIKIAIVDKNFGYLFAVPAVIATMHLARGVGSLWGVVLLFTRRRFGHAVRLALREVWS